MNTAHEVSYKKQQEVLSNVNTGKEENELKYLLQKQILVHFKSRSSSSCLFGTAPPAQLEWNGLSTAVHRRKVWCFPAI